MSDTLFGSTESGTPLETRGATQDLADLLRNVISGDAGLARLGSAASLNLGFDPNAVGIGSAAADALQDPSAATANLFQALSPLRREATQEGVAGLRESFGTMGGRFSRNIGMAEAELRSDISNQFARTRADATLQAQAQRNAALANILQSNLSSQAIPLQLLFGMLQPGGPVIQPGIIGQLLGAAATIGGAAAFGGGGGGGGGGAAAGGAV